MASFKTYQEIIAKKNRIYWNGSVYWNFRQTTVYTENSVNMELILEVVKTPESYLGHFGAAFISISKKILHKININLRCHFIHLLKMCLSKIIFTCFNDKIYLVVI